MTNFTVAFVVVNIAKTIQKGPKKEKNYSATLVIRNTTKLNNWKQFVKRNVCGGRQRDPSTIIILISTKLPVVKKSGADSANSRKILLLTLYTKTPVDYLIFRLCMRGFGSIYRLAYKVNGISSRTENVSTNIFRL